MMWWKANRASSAALPNPKPQPPAAESRNGALAAFEAEYLAYKPDSCDYSGCARNFEELCSAYRLTYQRQIAMGQMLSNRSHMCFSLRELLPSAGTLVAASRNRIIATLTIVLDSSIDLPMCEAFSGQLARLRSENRCVAEITLYSCEENNRGKCALIELMKSAVRFGLKQGVDDLCLVVDKSQAPIWQRILGFEVYGTAENAPPAKSSPERLMRLNLSRMLEEGRKADGLPYKIFSSALEPVENEPPAYRLSERQVIDLLSRDPTLALSATHGEFLALSCYYPLAYQFLQSRKLVPSLNPAGRQMLA